MSGSRPRSRCKKGHRPSSNQQQPESSPTPHHHHQQQRPFPQADHSPITTNQILYGIPLAPSFLPRLAALARALQHPSGGGKLGLFIDHPSQLAALLHHLSSSSSSWPTDTPIPIWVPIDVGYHREGIIATPGSSSNTTTSHLAALAAALRAARPHGVILAGLYAHLGNCYGVSGPAEALEWMGRELRGLRDGAGEFLRFYHRQSSDNPDGLLSAAASGKGEEKTITLSLGATPTTVSIQNLLLRRNNNLGGGDGGGGDDTASDAIAQEYRALITSLTSSSSSSFTLEFHAGVYPVLDLQQLATQARPDVSYADVGMRVLVEVASLYPGRGGGGADDDGKTKPEALIAAGSVALGREPCKSYGGWGVVSPWDEKGREAGGGGWGYFDPVRRTPGWIVGRIAQEHGVLVWEGEWDEEGQFVGGERGRKSRESKVGQKLMVWPNHACIAGLNFDWYLVVDSDQADPDQVRDVWVRCRGW